MSFERGTLLCESWACSEVLSGHDVDGDNNLKTLMILGTPEILATVFQGVM